MEWNASSTPQVFRHSLELPIAAPHRLLWVSDLHLQPWSRHVSLQVAELARELQPDSIVIGGDLVDLPWALPEARWLLSALVECATVLVIPGNHDWLSGLARVRAACTQSGAHWLEREAYTFPSGLRLCQPPVPLFDSSRSIALVHNPSCFPQACQAGYPLVLAGHLHGCQLILWERRGLQYPGAYFFRYNGRYFQRGSTTMLVSLGLHDTIPLRWNCPREVVLVEIGNTGVCAPLVAPLSSS